MDMEREEYLAWKQTERNRHRLEAVFAEGMGSAPRSPALGPADPVTGLE